MMSRRLGFCGSSNNSFHLDLMTHSSSGDITGAQQSHSDLLSEQHTIFSLDRSCVQSLHLESYAASMSHADTAHSGLK